MSESTTPTISTAIYEAHSKRVQDLADNPDNVVMEFKYNTNPDPLKAHQARQCIALLLSKAAEREKNPAWHDDKVWRTHLLTVEKDTWLSFAKWYKRIWFKFTERFVPIPVIQHIMAQLKLREQVEAGTITQDAANMAMQEMAMHATLRPITDEDRKMLAEGTMVDVGKQNT